MTSSLNPSDYGQFITLTATVTSGSGTPAGTVVFRDGAIVIGTATLDLSGHASMAASVLTTGSHSITAFYSGDSVFNPSTSVALMERIANANACGSLQDAVNYGAGSFPASVAAADFDGDGIADLAVASNGSGISILRGNGDGTFQPSVSYPAGTNPRSVAVGDVNADGRLDLVVTNENSGDVSILLGSGDGTFQPAVNYGTGTKPFSVALGDLNLDGRLDLAVANYFGDDVSILLGTEMAILHCWE